MSPPQRLLDRARRALMGTAPSSFSMLYHSTLVRLGEKHRERGRNCQDYALSRAVEQGAVFAVADGAGLSYDDHGFLQPSRNECGAILLAELAVRSALDCLTANMAPDDLQTAVASAIHEGLSRIWGILGETRGSATLGSTLLLGVVTPEWTRIYASGDGCWGMYLPSGSSLETLTGGKSLVSERPGIVCVRASVHTPRLSNLASHAAAVSVDKVRSALPCVLGFDGPVLGAWAASDGLLNESALLDHLHRTPPRSKDRVEELLQRRPDCDDLAVGWAVTRYPEASEVPSA